MKALLGLVFVLLSGCAVMNEPGFSERLEVALRGASQAYNAGYSSVTQYSVPTYDYQWGWDHFYNANYQLVWACRGVQTAQFAETWRCNGQAQTDWRWPQK